MRNRIILISLGVIIVAGLVILNVAPGKVAVTVDGASEVKNNPTVVFDKSAALPIPATKSLKPGKHTITAKADTANDITETVRVRAFQTTIVTLNFKVNPSLVPYYSLFPYDNGDVRLSAVLGDTDQGKQVVRIVAVIHYRFSDPSDPASVASERDFIVNEAKQWLKSQSVPDTIPLIVDDTQQY